MRGATALIMVVALFAGWLLFGLLSSARRHHDVALRTSELSAVVEHLDATEWHARTVGSVSASLDQEVQADLAQAAHLLRGLEVDAVVARPVAPAFGTFRAALLTELDLLRRGQTALAEEVDVSRVDPAFDRVHVALHAASGHAAASSESALRWLGLGSALVLAGAGMCIGLLGWRVGRARARSLAAETRAKAVAVSERRFRALVNHGSDIIIVADPDGVVLEISASIGHVLQVSASALVGRRITELVHPDEAAAAASAFARALSAGSSGPTEWRCRDGLGAWRDIEVRLTNLLDLPEVGAVVLNVRDVSDRHRLEAELRHRAFHDSLTGLANRALLRDRVEHAMAKRDSCRAALLVADLDGFKHLNDSLGHPAGDHALAVVADRLRGVSRPGDTVARLGGDEFAVLVEEPLAPDQAELLATRLADAIAQPMAWHDRPIVIGASVGVAFVEPSLHGPDDLIRNADVALYAAKTAGRGQVRLFDRSLFENARARFELENDLRHALEHDDLTLQYQPIVELDTDELVGFEALIRWEHPTRGPLSPDEFIPIAEDTGQIIALGRWVLSRACRDLDGWSRTSPYPRPLYVSVNLSARHLEDPHLLTDVRQALDGTDLEPGQLVLEVTESALMRDTQTATARLEALKALGVRLSVDDFGTGYSSLSYLRQFPIDTVKVDKSFVDDLRNHPGNNAEFLQAILQLGDALHLNTLAEGIETQNQADTLQRLGCRYGQGYHYARPLDPTKITELLHSNRTTTASPVPAD